MMGEALASTPPLPSPLSPPQEAAEVQPARDAGAGALAPGGVAPEAPGRSDLSRTCRRRLTGQSEDGGAAMLHADPVRRAQERRVQVMQGAPGGAALLLQAL